MKFKMPEYIETWSTSFYSVGYSSNESCFSLMVNPQAELGRLSISYLVTDSINKNVTIPTSFVDPDPLKIKYNVSKEDYSGTSSISITHYKQGSGRRHYESGKVEINILSALYLDGEYDSDSIITHTFTNSEFDTYNIKAFSISAKDDSSYLYLGKAIPQSGLTSIGTSDHKFHEGYFEDLYSDKFHGFLETLYASEQLGALYVLDIVVNRPPNSPINTDIEDDIPRGKYLCDGKLITSENENVYEVGITIHSSMSYTLSGSKHHFYILQRVHFTIASGSSTSSSIVNILAVYAGVARITPLL